MYRYDGNKDPGKRWSRDRHRRISGHTTCHSSTHQRHTVAPGCIYNNGVRVLLRYWCLGPQSSSKQPDTVQAYWQPCIQAARNRQLLPRTHQLQQPLCSFTSISPLTEYRRRSELLNQIHSIQCGDQHHISSKLLEQTVGPTDEWYRTAHLSSKLTPAYALSPKNL